MEIVIAIAVGIVFSLFGTFFGQIGVRNYNNMESRNIKEPLVRENHKKSNIIYENKRLLKKIMDEQA